MCATDTFTALQRQQRDSRITYHGISTFIGCSYSHQQCREYRTNFGASYNFRKLFWRDMDHSRPFFAFKKLHMKNPNIHVFCYRCSQPQQSLKKVRQKNIPCIEKSLGNRYLKMHQNRCTFDFCQCFSIVVMSGNFTRNWA